MSHSAEALVSLTIAFGAALIGGEVSMRLKLPAVVGQIFAGIAVGRLVGGLVSESSVEFLKLLGELGATFLLFLVGLETPFAQIGKVGKDAFKVALLGVLIPFILGYGFSLLWGQGSVQSLFVASAFIATSAGITAKVLQELGVLNERFSQVVLGAAVIDDILAMLVLSVVSATASGKGISALSLVWLLAQSIGFLIVCLTLGRGFAKKNERLLDKPKNPLSPWSLSILLCLTFAAFATYFGLAAIIGAFVVGMILAETEYQHWIQEKVIDLNEFIVPFFFIVTGMSIDLEAFSNPSTIGILGLMTLLAIVGKFLGGYLGCKEDSSIVGVAMVPRGEVGVIVASLAQGLGVITKGVYSLLVGMSILTTVFAVPILGILIKKRDHSKLNSNSVAAD
ncbi:MAG: cation:proton antiporter [Fimbriimonadales bacterium]|nr:cation:proton antiporter [Fimbriimonadales bacterium]